MCFFIYFLILILIFFLLTKVYSSLVSKLGITLIIDVDASGPLGYGTVAYYSISIAFKESVDW